MRRPLFAIALLAVALVTGLAVVTAGPETSGGTDAVRVDQVGYAVSEAKRAYLMTAAPADGARFDVVDHRGRTVHSGQVGASAGAWSRAYGAVHPIDLTEVRTPGTYRVRVTGEVRAESPEFRVDSPERLFAPLLADTVNFFQVQRDGADVVPGELDRKPSHLTDRRATVYEPPVFASDGDDVPAEPLRPRSGAGPVDVEGGWFDAGDYVKFTQTSAYALTQLLYAQREAGGPPALGDETAFGLRWLDKMWDGRTLYAQVGIGTGSEDLGFLGDHDVWRLPEADDALETGPGDEHQFIKYRPVFPAGPPGEKVSPNLAGRVSAAFALAAQLAADRGDDAGARRWLAEGASLYDQARVTDVGELVTAFPHAYYVEDSWQDDMELGATQLALAARALGDPRAGRWVREAAGWARAYLDTQPSDTLSLYDTSALAHADLVPLLRGDALAGRLVADLRRQLDSGVKAAAAHPFGHAVDVSQFDAATRSFGFAATAQLYRGLTGSRDYDAFGTRQRDFALGANAWGTSLMIGAGTTYPRCPQHQVANLVGLPRGAVVNGPNGAEDFESAGIPEGANACPADGASPFAAYDRPDARYLDDVRAWRRSEPAIDFTATAALAFALSRLLPD